MTIFPDLADGPPEVFKEPKGDCLNSIFYMPDALPDAQTTVL